jgi:hypothetical protein
LNIAIYVLGGQPLVGKSVEEIREMLDLHPGFIKAVQFSSDLVTLLAAHMAADREPTERWGKSAGLDSLSDLNEIAVCQIA